MASEEAVPKGLPKEKKTRLLTQGTNEAVLQFALVRQSRKKWHPAAPPSLTQHYSVRKYPCSS
jgi:hypothetical protein